MIPTLAAFSCGREQAVIPTLAVFSGDMEQAVIPTPAATSASREQAVVPNLAAFFAVLLDEMRETNYDEGGVVGGV